MRKFKGLLCVGLAVCVTLAGCGTNITTTSNVEENPYAYLEKLEEGKYYVLHKDQSFQEVYWGAATFEQDETVTSARDERVIWFDENMYKQIPTLSRTTVYNTLRMLSEKGAAQMITIDEHRVCYDGNPKSHVHFFCKKCGRVIDMMDEDAPQLQHEICIDGNLVQEQQLYYKGICSDCSAEMEQNALRNQQTRIN